MRLNPLLLVAVAVVLVMMPRDSFQPRGIRNHNPGNIRAGRDQWQGMVGADPEFVIFSAPKWGIRAMARILNNYRARGLVTPAQIIGTWAPSVENNTAAYVEHVAGRLGLHPDQPIPQEKTGELIAAIIKHENGVQPYTPQEIAEGVALA